MNTPDDLKYAETHEWVRLEGDTATIGITDHAQNELSDVVFVELPEAGRAVSAGEAAAVIESVKAASDIYAPIAGEITEVNEDLGNDPAAVNSDPYGNGWIFKLKVSDAGEVEKLLDAATYSSQNS